jgi:glycosyltransferase involved in cell wall biosynthesis
MKTLSIVLPAYNEQKNISRTSNVLIEKINELVIKNKISNESFIVFIDDGSRDNTWEEIIKQNQKKPKVLAYNSPTITLT